MDLKLDGDTVVITINKADISGIELSAGREYGYASLRGKYEDKDYFSVGYEFDKKDGYIPDFVVDLMGVIKSMGEKAGAMQGKEELDKEVKAHFDLPRDGV